MRKVGVVRFSFRVVVIPVFESTLANRDSPKRKGEVWAGDSFEGVGRGLANEGERGRWFFWTQFLALIEASKTDETQALVLMHTINS